MRTIATCVGVITTLSFLRPPHAAGQTTFPLDPVDRFEVALQLEKPLLPDVLGSAWFSSILEADALFPLGPTTTLRIGLPVAFARADIVDGTSVYAGNLRASFLFGEPGSLSSTFGVTLPTASNLTGPELAILVGGLPWLGDRDKWLEETFSVGGAVLPSRQVGSGGEVGLRLGGEAMVPTDFDNLWLDARAAGWGRVPVGRAELEADLTFSYLITSDDGFGRQSTAYLDLGASLTEEPGRPGVFFRIPLDGDSRDVLDLSIGVSARF
jgi:hypothetical protein